MAKIVSQTIGIIVSKAVKDAEKDIEIIDLEALEAIEKVFEEMFPEMVVELVVE